MQKKQSPIIKNSKSDQELVITCVFIGYTFYLNLWCSNTSQAIRRVILYKPEANLVFLFKILGVYPEDIEKIIFMRGPGPFSTIKICIATLLATHAVHQICIKGFIPWYHETKRVCIPFNKKHHLLCGDNTWKYVSHVIPLNYSIKDLHAMLFLKRNEEGSLLPYYCMDI